MKNNRETYKRVKINWWVVLTWSALFFLTSIILYILFRNGIFISMALPTCVILTELRYILTVDDNFITFRTDIRTSFKIALSDMENVHITQAPLHGMNLPWKKVKLYSFDVFEKDVVSIQLRNGKTYQLHIKNAQIVKEEIEKRIITTK